MRWKWMIALLVVSWAATANAAVAVAEEEFDANAYLINEAEELRLAATAGPKKITEGATYYVLRQDGFAKVKDGTNGFHCFVERSWSGPSRENTRGFNPRIRAPHCINPEGAQTTMKEIFLVSKLAMAGHSAEEIDQVVDRAYNEGDLTLPTGLSLTYMMSKHQHLADEIGAWKPHVMLWIPYLTEEQVGLQYSDNALLEGKPGSRRSVLVFALPDFIE